MSSQDWSIARPNAPSEKTRDVTLHYQPSLLDMVVTVRRSTFRRMLLADDLMQSRRSCEATYRLRQVFLRAQFRGAR